MAESARAAIGAAGAGQPREVSMTGLLLIVSGVMILLFFGDRFLAQLEQRELRQAARREFEEGEALKKAGKSSEAIAHYRRAHTLVRGDKGYALALADAQIANGQGDAARRILDELLAAEPNDARANLLTARWMVGRGRYTSADAYYHRAIYGLWPEGSSPRERLDARLELAEMLAVHGSQQEVLSETLALLEAAPESADWTRHVAPLLLRAGSGNRAAAAYRFLLRQNRTDAGAWAGLGQAELQVGDYRAAQTAFTSALQNRPGDGALGRDVELAGRLADLDPTPRRLSSREKLTRSMEVLRLAREEMTACMPATNLGGELRAKLDLADKLLAEPVGRMVTNEQAEARLDAAESLWSARTRLCAWPPAEDDVLPVIMAKLGGR